MLLIFYYLVLYRFIIKNNIYKNNSSSKSKLCNINDRSLRKTNTKKILRAYLRKYTSVLQVIKTGLNAQLVHECNAK